MDIKATSKRIRFGHCTLDEGRGVLTSPDGAETILRPKTFELLKLLLGNPGRVVARNEILDAVWPGLFVTDDSITQCVVELRRAMGQAGAPLLRTMPRRGYLLEAEVIIEAPMAPVAALLSPRADDRPSIAVLPFRKDAANPDEAYFADGIIEGIVHVLSGLERILVISRGSALAVAEATSDPREVGRRLGVRYVLQGGVRRAGEKLRIATELSDAETGAIIRTDRYDGETADIFALQDRIAERVVTTIAPEVREREIARALRKPPASLSAYDLVLRALDEMRRMDRAAMERSRALLEQAVAADPAQGLAYSYLGWWHVFWLAQGWARDVAAEAAAATRAATAALDHDRNDGVALAVHGLIVSYVERDFEQARVLLDQAVAASPSCALAWSIGAGLRCWLDEGAAAMIWAERAVRLAPIDPFAFLYEHILSQAYYTAGHWEQAITWGRASAASNPKHSPTWRTLAASLVAAGRGAEAAGPVRRVLSLEPAFSLAAVAARTPLRPPMRDVFIGRLRIAGLPD